MSHFRKLGIVVFPGSRRVQRVQRHTQLNRFSAILNVKEKRLFVSPPTIFVESSSKLPQMIFRPSLTKVIVWIFDFRNRLLITANQNDVAE